MGTNFYMYFSRDRAQLMTEDFHIGKRSAGWVFHFQAHEKPNIKTVRGMRKYTRLGFIYDEYGREYSYDEFWLEVERTKKCTDGISPLILEDPENPEPVWFKRWEDEGFCFSEGEFS